MTLRPFPWRAAFAAALFGGSPLGAFAADYADVLSATPVTSTVAVPRQSCIDGERYVQPRPSGAGALIGALVGGVVGNQFGHGFGRAAATGLGVVAGSAIGNHAEAGQYGPQAVPVRDCRTVSAYEERVVGYDVVYEYNGQRYTTRTASDPGRRLAIDVRPVDAAPIERYQPAPSTGYRPVPPVYRDAPVYREAPAYVEAPPAYRYYEAAPVYVEQAPVYYAPGPAVYAAPLIGIGVGVGLGLYGAHRWQHGHHGGHRGGHRRWRH